MKPTHHIACDLGAESGRVVLGKLTALHLELEEVHRFKNVPFQHTRGLCWDVESISKGVTEGVRLAASKGLMIDSVSTDSWGVDYVLHRADGSRVDPTFHYRDSRTERGVEAAFQRVKWPEVFSETGIQFMGLNTLFQLMAESGERLAEASIMLGIGDSLNYLMSGNAVEEVSMASTTQLYNPLSRGWSDKLISALKLPKTLFPPIVESGTKLGRIRPIFGVLPGLTECEVVASCSHDTGAAVAAVPGIGKGWAYLSSGTWSLIGVERPQPILSDACRDLNFTNEIGFGGSVRFLKNIVGLWIIQECRRQWLAEGRNLSYGELTAAALSAQPFRSLIDANDKRFLAPGNMPSKIENFCIETNQPVPVTHGEFVRCVLESLAVLYARTLRQIEKLTGEGISQLHIVGGGSKNELLNQLTANAAGVEVVAGPEEATAVGNILVQAVALGRLGGIDDLRKVVARSFQCKRYLPTDPDEWEQAAGRLWV